MTEQGAEKAWQPPADDTASQSATREEESVQAAEEHPSTSTPKSLPPAFPPPPPPQSPPSAAERPQPESSTCEALLVDVLQSRAEEENDLKRVLQAMPMPEEVPLPGSFSFMSTRRSPAIEGHGHTLGPSVKPTSSDDEAGLSLEEASGTTWPRMHSDASGSSSGPDAPREAMMASDLIGETETCASASDDLFIGQMLHKCTGEARGEQIPGNMFAEKRHAPHISSVASIPAMFHGSAKTANVFLGITDREASMAGVAHWNVAPQPQVQGYWGMQQQAVWPQTAATLQCWTQSGYVNGGMRESRAAAQAKPQFCIHCGRPRIQELQRFCISCGAKSFA